MHPCEEDLVCKGSIEKVPYFNAPIYLENKSQIGKVDEIFGPMNSYVMAHTHTHTHTLSREPDVIAGKSFFLSPPDGLGRETNTHKQITGVTYCYNLFIYSTFL